MMMLRSLLAVGLVLIGAVTAHAQDALHGRIDGNRYVSPTGQFRVTIPVLPELGGNITDTPNVVTFQDAFNLHVSIACFEMDATQRWESSTRGPREYLIWFYSQFLQEDFSARFPGARIESARFFPTVESGALVVYNLLPGGSMFQDRIALTSEDGLPVAKRGNLLFIHDQHIYVISTELSEKVILRRSYEKTTAEEDEILRKRLFDTLGRMTFTSGSNVPPAS